MARGRVLGKAFYARPAEVVARELLGKWLVRRAGDELHAAPIYETEAYVGPHDLACHGRFGCTPRTAVMFGPAGVWYVYLIYGMYWMLNVVTDEPDYPAAVLFRAAGAWSGPGKLTRGMAIDRSLNGLQANRASGLWIEDRGEIVAPASVQATPRIGIDYAGEWRDKLYRFLMPPPAEFAKQSPGTRRARPKP